MMLEFSKQFPVMTPHGYGWPIYVESSGGFGNDIWAVALEEGGHVRHYRSDQIKVLPNGTLDIKEKR